MSRYLLYVGDEEGMVQARLALHLLRQADSTNQWTLQHGGKLQPEQVAAFADVLILSDDSEANADFAGHHCYSLRATVNDPASTLAKFNGQNPAPEDKPAPPAPPIEAAPVPRGQNIVGVTSCPTGIAHTFMAAEGLQAGAEALGLAAKIETQGSVGANNQLTAAEIAAADVVIIAADTKVDLNRFIGKRLYQTSTKNAIQDGREVVARALQQAAVYGSADDIQALQNTPVAGEKVGVYQHLMTGMSYMLPFVVAGGLLIALGFFFGSLQFGDKGIFIYQEQYRGTLAATLFWIGKDAFALFVPVLGGYIAYSRAGRPGLAPGMIGGYIAMNTGAGFLGAIVAGFLAGWSVDGLNKALKLPRTLDGLKPTLILPLVGALIVGLLMYYVIGEPVARVLALLTASLREMSTSASQSAVVGALLGLMMAFDMGGPVNKAAYIFATALIASQEYAPMAAVMASGMTPPLAIFGATLLFRNRFTNEEREAGKAAGILGLCFITEGAIPFATKDPLRVIPALMAGSAVAGALSIAMGCLLRAPHGGIFVLFIPNAVSHLGWYLVALLAGTAVSCLLLGVLKKPLSMREANAS